MYFPSINYAKEFLCLLQCACYYQYYLQHFTSSVKV